MVFKEKIFTVASEKEFLRIALELFHFQFEHNKVYRAYVVALDTDLSAVDSLEKIPFMPIEFFKTHEVVCGDNPPQRVFLSSATTGTEPGRHLVSDLNLYRQSLKLGFQHFYGSPEQSQFLALMPSPEQNPHSSLVFMLANLMDLSMSPENGFFLHGFPALYTRLRQSHPRDKTVFLFGLTHALLDFAEQFPGEYGPLIVIETGGMKGKRREMVREELHAMLGSALGLKKIHSEYSMTELLSQAYSNGDGFFRTPPWMRILIRETNDPFSYEKPGATGGINIIDLANIYSCAFISTQDLGRLHPDGRFEVLGRFDSADTRGCSLMI